MQSFQLDNERGQSMSKVKLSKKGNTKIQAGNDGATRVILHSTCVVLFDAEKIVLNSGGWRTVTTLARMNQASQEFNLGYVVFQRKGKWLVKHARFAEVVDFQDGL